MKQLLALFFSIFCLGVQAQDSLRTVDDKLTVGLVLSGGGAKGLAHIGALKIIDSAGVRIDYIGGTSMGAIIGSLYAAGYSAKELDSTFHKTNFTTLIQDELPRQVKTFYEKEQSGKYAISLPFDNFELSIPSGLSKGQNVYNLISRLTAHLNGITDFSKMPIPFFAIGTDIETGKEIVLDGGSLPLAVTASSAIPSIFSPVEVNGQLLVDGGVVNNYPVRELRKKDLDIIIGVNVQDSLVDRKKLGTGLEILTQVNNFRTIKAMEEKIPLTNVYIRPDISDFTILSFGKGEAIIEKGKLAAAKKFDELKWIAKRQNQAIPEKPEPPKMDSLYIRAINITGDHGYPRSYVRGKLKIDQYEKIAYKDLIIGVNNLSATDNFKRIDYNLIPVENGYNLSVNLQESEQKTSLKLAVHYDELFKTGLLLNLTHKSLLFQNDIASIDFILGDNIRYKFNYFIDKGRYWSLGFNSRYDHLERGVSFEFVAGIADLGEYNVNKIEIEYADFTNQIFAETFFVEQFRLGLGLEHKYVRIKTETIIEEENTMEEPRPFTILEESNFYSALGYLELDNYDHKYFPAKGYYFRGDFHLYLFASQSTEEFSEFAIAKGIAGYATPVYRDFSARLSAETGFRIGNNASNTLNFYLGGYGNKPVNNLVPFFGYDFLGIAGDSYIKALGEIDYRFWGENHLIASYNIANVENDIYGSGEWFTLPDYTGFALGYGRETFLGPVEVKYSYSPERGESEWFFSVGFWF